MTKPENAPRSSRFDRLLAEAEDVRTVRVSQSKEIGYCLLNEDLLGEERPIVAVGGFVSDLTTASRVWEGLHLAALGRPVLMLDLPGHGFSSPHTLRQTYDLCVLRSLESHAAPMTEAVQQLRDLLGREDSVDYFGLSHGGLVALKMAEQDPQDRIRTVFGADIPAVKKRWTMEMQFSYLVSDGFLGRSRCLKAPENSESVADFQIFSRAYAARCVNGRSESFIRKDPLLALANLFASVDARPVALEAWARIMADKTASVHVVTGKMSKVSDCEAIGSFIKSLEAEARARSHQTVVRGKDHNISSAYFLPRLVTRANEAYKS